MHNKFEFHSQRYRNHRLPSQSSTEKIEVKKSQKNKEIAKDLLLDVPETVHEEGKKVEVEVTSASIGNRPWKK